MSHAVEEFDYMDHLRRRNRDLTQRTEYLEAENERLFLLLGILLRMSSRTTGIRPGLIMDAVFSAAWVEPAKAPAQELHPFIAWLAVEELRDA